MATEENQIRKFRKKLRQIEHLESLRRELTPNEITKISTKDSIRSQLQILLSQIIEETDVPRVPHVSRSRFKLPETPRELSSAESIPAADLLEQGERQQVNDNSTESVMRKRKLIESEIEKLQNENNENRINGKQQKADLNIEGQDVVQLTIPSTSASTSQSNEDVRKKYRDLEHAKVVTRELRGHSDIVWALSADEKFIVSGSRDTTARIWDSESGEEVCSLRGHSGSVNGVAILNLELSQELATKLEYTEASQIVFTASTDCSLRLWAVPSGKQIKFLYTFNSITCLGVIDYLLYAVTGTDGGKVEVWDAVTSRTVYSCKAHNESVSCLEVKGSQFCSGSVDGLVIIWTIANKKVEILYQLDPTVNSEVPHLRSLFSIASHYGRLFLGGSGATIKVLSWRRDRMHAVRNHPRNYGCTNALIAFEDLLVSSSFNLDSGLGSVNIRLLPEVEYLCSVYEQMQKILCISCLWNKTGGLRLVCGGEELLICDFVDSSYTKNLERCGGDDILDVCRVESLDYEPEKVESEDESLLETTDDEKDLLDSTSCTEANMLSTNATVPQRSWYSWCTLV